MILLEKKDQYRPPVLPGINVCGQDGGLPPGVFVCIYRLNGRNEIEKLLLLQRSDNLRWGIISGKAEPTDRTLRETAFREVAEEIGLIPVQLIDTGIRRQIWIASKRAWAEMAVFAAIISNNSEIHLDDENIDYKFVPVQEASHKINMLDQRDLNEICLRTLQKLQEESLMNNKPVSV